MGEKLLAMFVAAIVKHIPEYCAALAAWLIKKAKSLTSSKAQKAAEENLSKVDADPKATPNEKADAYEKYINS